ncbi:O-sialoglycoprotein endopeptidase [Anoxybacter fermentans]|uniref:N(6)-L-threonylcarbamoyladenine synthase n=1 Tax=Anoxybacter fermentans TaxID=1323375 RepID=A0A3S9SYZ4_9FIRM|nr:O-sialoglycoprotein endopeptidase [Anoxybacter fermentans]AZR73537.1 O-sialoglycoprotein endopeptidase [Anoxybacter fermentans]
MILGIDTSNYTTSVAVVSKEQQLLFDKRIVLNVPEGKRGLQQSEAVFQHLKNLPDLLEKVLDKYRASITGICYSMKPRPIEGSYMPVFKVGEGYARAVAKALGVPLYPSTHQEGHLAAGLWSVGFMPKGPFLAMHLSGGTTDLLRVEPYKGGFRIELLGSSGDLHAGQFVDRIGVMLGLKFPAGPALEELARKQKLGDGIRLPSSVEGYMVSFSGPCSAAEREIRAGVEPEKVAFAVFRCIANSVEKVLLKAIEKTGLKEVLFVGGVAANSFIKERLIRRLEHPAVGARLYFAKPHYSRDNAVGIAVIKFLLR